MGYFLNIVDYNFLRLYEIDVLPREKFAWKCSSGA